MFSLRRKLTLHLDTDGSEYCFASIRRKAYWLARGSVSIRSTWNGANECTKTQPVLILEPILMMNKKQGNQPINLDH